MIKLSKIEITPQKKEGIIKLRDDWMKYESHSISVKNAAPKNFHGNISCAKSVVLTHLYDNVFIWSLIDNNKDSEYFSGQSDYFS